ncbi:hypothetical protein [Pelobacter seleniigenes]|uniref:hypothetical protein n=1 Tax=Pelobacter seleniigenes TaxID=407188 RepID=UPI00068A8CC0|nr:hypothetical protein [Pelobacter seleniigenes]
MEKGTFRNWTFSLDTVDFYSQNFADHFHHAKKEGVLFVDLGKNGMPEKHPPIKAMLIEHDRDCHFVGNMEAAAQKVTTDETEQISAIVFSPMS